MACAYHRSVRNGKAKCSDECPMQVVFDGSNHRKFRLLSHLLGWKAAGGSVFSNFFADRSAEERFSVADSLRWVSELWDLDPIRGPFGAYCDIQAEILNLKDRCFVVQVCDEEIVPTVADVPFGPLLENKNKRCLYHKKAGGGVGSHCDADNCMFYPLFPPTSNEAAFLSIYSKFAGQGIIPKFFGGLKDLQSRQSVAASLFWEAACWFFDPVHGPKGQFDEQQRILSSLFPPEFFPVMVFGVDLNLDLSLKLVQYGVEVEHAEECFDGDAALVEGPAFVEGPVFLFGVDLCLDLNLSLA